MATVWASSSAPRARLSAGPLRVMWLAALLFGVLYTHGVSAETAASHLTNHAIAAATHAADDHPAGKSGPLVPPSHDDSLESHPAGQCVSGQPQLAPGLDAPALTPLAGALSWRLDVPGEPGPSAANPAPPPLEFSALSVVQRI